MKVIVVNGQCGSGKTTFEKLVEQIAEQKGKKVKIISTIDYVKNIATFLGWSGKKDEKDRRMLSDLKDLLTRWNDSPYNYVFSIIKENQLSNDVDLLFVDCREPKEIQRFVDDFKALTLIVKRYAYTDCGNHADNNVYDFSYDIDIDNSRGLAELKEEAEIFVETFLEEK